MSTSDAPLNLRGRTVIVTGASSGLGRATATALAAAGARVVLAVRDTERGQRVAARMAGSTDVRRMDLASLRSIRLFAAAWDSQIDLLINNAGVMLPPGRNLTEDGFELQLGINHLGHFTLTNLLLPYMADTGRVVSVSSVAHRIGRIRFDDLNWEHRRYNGVRAYSDSKLANLLFASELQRRLTLAGSNIRSVTAHPGYAHTNLLFHTGNPLLSALFWLGNHTVGFSAERGAQNLLFAATEDIPGDSFGAPRGSSSSTAAPDSCRAPPAPGASPTPSASGRSPNS